MLFIRATRGGEWDPAANSDSDPARFPATVMADIIDAQGETSLWKVPDLHAPEVIRIAAALHRSDVKSLSDMRFLSVDEKKLSAAGINTRQTTGLSLDANLNKSGTHFVAITNNVVDAMKLAGLLFAEKPVMIVQRQVMLAFARSIEERWISSRNITPELWNKLFDEKFLRCVAEK